MVPAKLGSGKRQKEHAESSDENERCGQCAFAPSLVVGPFDPRRFVPADEVAPDVMATAIDSQSLFEEAGRGGADRVCLLCEAGEAALMSDSGSAR